MKTLTCEAGTLADAVQRAARVAPTRGEAFDRACGIQIELVPESNSPVRIKATDLQSTYFQKIQPVSIGDEAATWRLPAQLLTGFVSSLPLNAGSQVTLTESSPGLVTLKCGRARAKLRSIVDPLPKIEVYAPDGAETAAGLAKRIRQVAFAAHNDPAAAPLSGVHIDGDSLIACDRHRIALAPCKVPLDAPVTVPLQRLAHALRGTDEVSVLVKDDRLVLMPDADTQMTCAIFQAAYPDVRGVVRGLEVEKLQVTTGRELIQHALNRALVLAKGERYPRACLTFTSVGDHFGMELVLDGVGEVKEQIPCVYRAASDVEVWVNPQNLLQAISNAGSDELHIESDGDSLHPMRVSDGSGYETWLMPLRP